MRPKKQTSIISALFFAAFLCFMMSCHKNNKEVTPSSPSVASLIWEHVNTSLTPVAEGMYAGTFFLPYTGGNGAEYDDATPITSTGVTGLTAVLQKGKLNNSFGYINYTVSGAPSGPGTAIFLIKFGGHTVSVSIQINSQNAPVRINWGYFDNTTTPASAYMGYGKQPSSTIIYIGFEDFPTAFCQNADANGMITDVSWQPDNILLNDIVSGKYDSYLQKFGQEVASFGKPVMLRFANEFNGDWSTWSYNASAGGLVPASLYVQAFKYVHDKVMAAGGFNAYWIWSPNVTNGGMNTQSIESYYPGDNYVDIIGMDGYNWGTSQSWTSWQSFESVFGACYDQLVASHPNKLIGVTETGCSSTGGDKAAWITDMFNGFTTRFPKLKFFTWFNINKETDWRFTSDQASINALEAGLQNQYIIYDRTIGGMVK